MKCRSLVPLSAGPSANEGTDHVFPIGYVFDFPKAYLYVQQGIAEPADEECEKAAGLTPEQRIIRQEAYRRLEGERYDTPPEDDTDLEVDIEIVSDPEYL